MSLTEGNLGCQLAVLQAGILREQEENVDDHSNTEDTENDVGLPGDVGESTGNKQGQSEVKDPVERSTDTVGKSSLSKREDFRAVNPDTRTPGRSERTNEKIRTSNDSLGSSRSVFRNQNSDVGVTINTVDGVTVNSQQTRNSKQPGHHENTTNEQQRTTTPAVNEEKSRNSHDHVKNVLDGRRNKVDVTSVTSHFEDVNNVVHSDIDTSHLLPDLSPNTDHSTVQRILLEKIQNGSGLRFTVNSDNLLDLLNLDKNIRVIDITVSLSSSNDLNSFFPSVLTGQPTRRLRQTQGTNEQQETRDDLNTPSSSERSLSRNERTTITNVEHDHDTPGDSPLEETNKTTTDVLRSELGNIDRNLGRGQTNSETSNNSTND
ncbi:hypothetical protein AWJ20_5345 [Sugiyamaella lignohabitans]|uniref:Uncharacterized protein n=1 Tax=Sugiyamaella lignohabitans TaxID=796027 RepID=A0A167ER29_9ASCO|nr:uncharacterized protein AWJ20_5345 [Sugiyamaella lignohabitans]ANB14372.1 hypothetical protein AWJ20_5345 [Sugiyamaella lignohabitans]